MKILRDGMIVIFIRKLFNGKLHVIMICLATLNIGHRKLCIVASTEGETFYKPNT